MHTPARALATLLLAAVLASCQWLVPGGSSGPLPTDLPAPQSGAPRLSPSIEIPPPQD